MSEQSDSTNPLLSSPNKLKLGVFGVNVSGGCSMTSVPSTIKAEWDESVNIAQAADRIIVHPTSLTGSIGVIALKMNLSGLMDKVGVDFEVVKSGDHKDFLSPFRALTKDERLIFQETIDNLHQRFVSTIEDNRKQLNRDEIKKLADGRIYTSQQALDAKLIDQIAYMDEAEEFIKKDLKLDAMRLVIYHRTGQYKSNIYSSLPVPPSINFNFVNLNFIPETPGPNFMYLWMP